MKKITLFLISFSFTLILIRSIATELTAHKGSDTFTYIPLIRHDGLPATFLISKSSSGVAGDKASSDPNASADGRYIVFQSFAENLVGGDTNDTSDIFLHDRQTGQTYLISKGIGGTPTNGSSRAPVISADGRYIAFESYADNLVSNDNNFDPDIFLYDRQTDQTQRVSVATNGTEGNNGSGSPAISNDGRFIAFDSSANNLVSNDNNFYRDVFVHDHITGETTLISKSSGGVLGNDQSRNPSISGDGLWVSFYSQANNLVPNDTNANGDIFVHDRQTGETNRVSVASDGSQASGYDRSFISTNGRYIAFMSSSSTIATPSSIFLQVYIHDRQTEATIRVSVASDGATGDHNSFVMGISDSGQEIIFASEATNLIGNDTNNSDDIFVHHWVTGETERVSLTYQSQQANDDSSEATFSGDGQLVFFQSHASNLIPDSLPSGISQIFVHER